MRLFIKSVMIFCIPIIVLIGVYIWTDPFKIIYNYDIYLSDIVMLNRALVSTEVFLKNNQQSNFDSFIFGSSRSCAYTSKEWGKYLSKDCSAFSYGAWNESIEGIVRKIQFIDSNGNKIKNVIIVIDTDLTFAKDNYAIEEDHYLISGKSFGQFHLKYFSEFIRRYWLIPSSVDYKIFKTKRSYMKYFIGMKGDAVNPINNDFGPNSENEILPDSTAYYSKSLNKFYSRPTLEKQCEIQISPNDSLMMQKINSIFRKQKTNVKIIIGPLYNQARFNYKDIQILKAIFGAENIFDFSGINAITNDMYSYTNDAIHYRKRTGNRILKSIYKLPSSTIK